MPLPSFHIGTGKDPAFSHTLLLLNAEIVKNPRDVEAVTQHLKLMGPVHRQVLDRVLAGVGKLPNNIYDLIYVAPVSMNSGAENDEKWVKLDKKALEIMHKALAPGGRLAGALDVKGLAGDALLAGFVESADGVFYVKSASSMRTAVSVPLKKRPINSTQKKAMPVFKKLGQASTSNSLYQNSTTSGIVSLALKDLDDPEGDDDLLDENTLISESSKLASPIILLPPQCVPAPGQKRRKACKDCTCGLRGLELQEEEAQRARQAQAVVTIDAGDDEIDFTVPAAKTQGSCGSCALGDAFRCDGCPYMGLPPFKVGEIVNIEAMQSDI